MRVYTVLLYWLPVLPKLIGQYIQMGQATKTIAFFSTRKKKQWRRKYVQLSCKFSHEQLYNFII